MRFTLHSIRLVASLSLFGGLLPTGGHAAKRDPEPANAPPQLISTKGGGPQWTSLRQMEQLADKGDPQACFQLGTRLMEGNELPRDLPRAQVLLEQAARGGVADACFLLGKIQHNGLVGPPDYGKALEFFTQAARAGIAEAQHNIGAMLVSARGVRRNYVEGLAWLIVARKSGADPEAENKVRARIAGRPADIQAAEARATVLLADLARATVQAVLIESVKLPTPTAPAPPRIDPVATPKPVLSVPPVSPLVKP